MKKIKFKIRGKFGELQATEKEKNGYVIVLPDYPGLRLAANKMTFEGNSNIQWNITDLRTGYRFLLGDINETLKSCIGRCLERVNKFGLVYILQMQDEVLKKYNRVEANPA